MFSPARHRLDVRPGASIGHSGTQGVAVVGAVGEQNLAFCTVSSMSGCAASVMRLSLGQLERDGMPLASTTAWILVVNPPRERPMHRAGARSRAADGARGPPF